MRATFANIYLDNLCHNIEQVKNNIPNNTKICLPVKADAYGHGAVSVAKTALECNVSYLAVAAVAEGIQLRKAGIQSPILVLSLPHPSEFDEIIDNNLTPSVFDTQIIDMLDSVAAEHKKILSVHLKIDTGMGRIGCLPSNSTFLAESIAAKKWLKLEGVFTHFSVADSLIPEDIEYTKKQIDLFVDSVQKIKSIGIQISLCHCANSAAIFAYPQAAFDMVRPGIVSYGYYPGDITKEYLDSIGKNITLKPVMELRSRLVSIRHFSDGEYISYGRKWQTKEDCDVGVLPLGYADGLLRRYGKNLRISINGNTYPLCGRICMDQCMTLLGKNHNIDRWTEAIIFGPKDKGAFQDASDIANFSDTIPYEITCGIDKRVPRIYLGK
ncbi:MAG: alanine racemase [Spirochaetaceae bacterium]|nr:alanine racemase [Spirochaetaceae bacterium]